MSEDPVPNDCPADPPPAETTPPAEPETTPADTPAEESPPSGE